MVKLATYQRAIEKAEEVCQRAAQGDLEARIVNIEEVAELSGFLNAINHMLDLTDAFVREAGASLEFASQRKYYRPFVLRGMLGDFRRGAQIINSARETMERRHILTEDFQATVTGTVGVFSNAASQLKKTASGMAADAETTHRQSLAVSAASEEAAVNAQAVAASSEELSASIGEIGRQVAESSSATQNVVGEMDQANEAVKALTGAAEKIDQVVAFISNVAGQTNLLALNATIEAARAGEAGRGFAVVAQEVKTLAGQVANATADITNQVKAMQEASELTAAAIGRINSRITDVSEVATVIASAIEEQTAATSEINSNVQQAAAGAQEVSTNVVSITEASEKTGAAAKDLQTSAQDLSQEAESMNGKVAEFLEKIRTA